MAQASRAKLPDRKDAAIIVALFAVSYVVLPPWNTPYVLLGAALGAVMFGAFLVGFRIRPALAWWFAVIVWVLEQLATLKFFAGENTSPSAGFAHHGLLALTTMIVLIALFGRRILHRLGQSNAA